MKTKTLKLSKIKAYKNNPRKISEEAVTAVKASIEKFGYNSPIVVDGKNVIIMGHTRHKALTELGWEEAGVIVADHLNPEQCKKLRVIDNRVGELANWDLKLLQDELRAVAGNGEMDDFFTDRELAKLIGSLDSTPSNIEPPTKEQISQVDKNMTDHYSEETERKANELVKIACPECKESFFIDKKLAE